MRDEAPGRNLCMEFWRGNHFAYLNSRGGMTYQATVYPEKPRHRFRLSRNLILDIVEHEVSAATQRVPGYEINPSSTDPDRAAAAKTAGKVARYGYDKWSVRGATEEVVRFALIQDMGFAWPYFDNTKGSQIAEDLAEGEICVEVFGPNEVFWEPGVKYEESTWMGIQQAMPVEKVQAMAPFKVTADASKSDGQTNRQKQSENLSMVTQYFERPSMKKPQGSWLTITQDKVIEDKDYPCTDTNGAALDEPLLVPLTYAMDPDSDTDMGLVRHLIDPMRTINDCVAKQLEWKNLALNPQVIVRNGVWKGPKLNDEPGMVYKVFGNAEPVWRPVPPIPPELNQIKEDAISDMLRIAAQGDIPSQIESGKAVQAVIERDQARRQAFVAKLAEFHSRLMTRCLYLVQKHYSEDRLLKIRGRYGPEIIQGFRGADLRSQIDVVVAPGSIEPRTRAAIEQKLMNLVQMFPGAFSPEQVMAAMEGGSAESLIESYELDTQRAHAVIQKIKLGPEVLFAEPPRPVAPGEETQLAPGPPDPATGQPGPPIEQPIIDPDTGLPITEVPGWLPRPFDNIPVQKKVFEDFMKTSDFDSLEPGMKAACFQYYAVLDEQEQQKAEKAQARQAQMAEGMGMTNAASGPGGPGGKPLPSMPALT